MGKPAAGEPFSYQIHRVVRQSGFSVLHLTYPSPVVSDVLPNNSVPAELYLPDGAESWRSPRPAVICVHILDGNFELVRMACSMLASRGIPALMFKLPYYGERSPPEGTRALAVQPRRFVAAIEQAMADVRRTVDVLASRPEIDPEAIGITGISLGGIVAATAAAEEPRLHRAMLVLAGGDLRAIIDHARETRQLSETLLGLPESERAAVDEALAAVDPLSGAAALRARAERGRVMMVNAGDDEVIPRRSTERLAEAIGLADQVVWLEGLGHYTAMAAMPEILEKTVDFFGQDLPPDARRPDAAEAPSAVQLAMAFAQKVSRLVGEAPEENRCHLIDVQVDVLQSADQEVFVVGASLALGHGGRFKIDVRTSPYGRIAMGVASEPWMLAGSRVLVGGGEPGSEMAAEPLLGDADQAAVRALAGALRAATMAPGVFEQLLSVEEAVAEDGRPKIHLARKGGSSERVALVLDSQRMAVRRLEIDWDGGRASVEIKAFEVNAPAHEALFRLVEGPERQHVDRDDLRAIFRSAAQFAIGRLIRR